MSTKLSKLEIRQNVTTYNYNDIQIYITNDIQGNLSFFKKDDGEFTFTIDTNNEYFVLRGIVYKNGGFTRNDIKKYADLFKLRAKTLAEKILEGLLKEHDTGWQEKIKENK